MVIEHCGIALSLGIALSPGALLSDNEQGVSCEYITYSGKLRIVCQEHIDLDEN